MARKIAIIGGYASPLASLGSTEDRGQNGYIAHVARNLAYLGYQVDVFTSTDRGELPEVYEWLENVRVVHVPAEPTGFNEAENLSASRSDFSDYMIEFFNQQEKPYDLIHAHLWASGLVAAEIKEALGIPFVLTFHGPGKGQRSPQKRDGQSPQEGFEIEDRVVRRADGIIAGSSQDREDLIALYDANPMYIVQIPDGYCSEQLWATDNTEPAKHLGVLEDERPTTLSQMTWQNAAGMLTEFYEDVLAVRRVGIIRMDGAPQSINQETHPNGLSLIGERFAATLQTFQEIRETLGDRILDAARLVTECLNQGGRILVCGNGESAALAQHFADELAGDFIIPGGAGLPVLALTAQATFWVDWSNNIGTEQVFAMQVETLGRPGDLLLGISAGGDSENLAEAFRFARANNIRCLALLGDDSGDLPSLSDVALVIPGTNARSAQEVHLFVLHLLGDLVAEQMPGSPQIMAESFYDATHAIPVLRQ